MINLGGVPLCSFRLSLLKCDLGVEVGVDLELHMIGGLDGRLWSRTSQTLGGYRDAECEEPSVRDLMENYLVVDSGKNKTNISVKKKRVDQVCENGRNFYFISLSGGF